MPPPTAVPSASAIMTTPESDARQQIAPARAAAIGPAAATAAAVGTARRSITSADFICRAADSAAVDAAEAALARA